MVSPEVLVGIEVVAAAAQVAFVEAVIAVVAVPLGLVLAVVVAEKLMKIESRLQD